MAKRRLGVIVSLLCICLCFIPYTALAAATSDAKEPISPDRECSLTICYGYDITTFPNQTVKLYKIADVSANFQYALTSSFATSGLILNDIQTNGEWDAARSTLEAYILANNITPTQTVVTDESGQACFTQLTPGLYLSSDINLLQDSLPCFFASALVSLPGLSADNLWQYQVTVTAKPEVLPPIEPNEEIQLKVLKLWKNDGNRSDRSKNIEVEIFRDGTSYETVVLSEDTHWSYSWTAKADGASWNVTERNVPSGYAMTVEQRGTSFIITNTHQDKPDSSSAQTGDTANILLYAVLLFVSGTMLIILGIVGKRKRHEETN